MIRTLVVASLALSASAAALPQDRAVATRAIDTVQAEYDALVAEYTVESDMVSAARRAIYESDAYKKAREARDNAKAAELMRDVPSLDRNAWAERFLGAAAKHGASDKQPLFYTWVVTSNAKKELVVKALEPMLGRHLKSDHWLGLSSSITRTSRALGQERVFEIIATLVEEHPNNEVKANALYGRYSMVSRSRSASDAEKESAELDRQRVIELAPNSKSGLRAAAVDFERERLQIGMQVPDIQGDDTTGVNFKLSDYKGKVVVLDFWGDW